MADQEYIDKIELKLRKLEHHMVSIKRELSKIRETVVSINLEGSITEQMREDLSLSLSKRNKHISAINEELLKVKNEVDPLNKNNPAVSKADQHVKKLEQHILIIKKEHNAIKNEIGFYSQEENPDSQEKEPIEEPKSYKKESNPTSPVQTAQNSDIESFIGTNIISKVGIGLLVLGVGIGAKYAIEEDLIGPGVRIVSGYIFGFTLLALSIYLKNKYESFASVLFSGAMSIMYFITYFAFEYYHMLGREVAFGMMIIFTVFTVFTAIKFDRQLIAHLGLVGSYAIPFLLSASSANVTHLFIYMTIINSGILIVSIKKYWISLYYSAFGLTWIIYAVWYFAQYNLYADYNTAVTFAIVFFFIFYITLIGYKLVHTKKFEELDIIFVTLNSLIFFGFGYAILERESDYIVAGFTLANAAIHLIAKVIAKQFNGYDKNFNFFTLGLAIAFVTITVPILAEGNWLAVFWAVESAVLFWIGRKQKVLFYEVISYVLISVSLIAMILEWEKYYNHISSSHSMFNNEGFLSSSIILSSLGVIRLIGYITRESKTNNYNQVVTGLLLSTVYMLFFLEINAHWELKLVGTYTDNFWYGVSNETKAIRSMKMIWLLNYSMIYVSVISWLNILKFKSFSFGSMNLLVNSILISIFLLMGLYQISYRPELNAHMDFYFMRYVTLGFFFFLVFTTLWYAKQEFITLHLKVASEVSLLVIILWVATSELFNWAQITHLESFYKLGLSLLWGFYGFGLMIYGIARKRKYLRITAICLFGLTILKLFFYDLANLNTLSKTIVMISLGVLLLIISFLYNKYAEDLLDNEKASVEE